MVHTVQSFNLASHQVRNAAFKKVVEVASWSMDIASKGLGPTRGFEGESFKDKSFRANIAGKKLAQSYTFLKRN